MAGIKKGMSARGKRRTGGRKATGTDGARAAVVTALFIAVAVFVSVFAAVFHSLSAAPEPPAPLPQIVEATYPETAPAEPESVAAAAPSAEAPPEAAPAAVRPEPSPAVVSAPEKAPAAPAPERRPAERTGLPAARRPAPAALSPRGSAPPERVPRPGPGVRGAAAIVIDDAGNNLRELRPFLAFPGPLAIAVLPGLPHSAEAARLARAAGKEVFLHQPMEALGGQNPGPGAIYVGMSEKEIRGILERNVAEVGPVVGMNNHQGSRVTSDAETMRIVLEFCKERGLLFLDSRTTADTVVPAVAARTGIHIGERDVFVDNIQERAAMIRYLQEGLQKAEKKGSAVMIGHAWSSELASALQELYPELLEQGFSLSTVARIVMGKYDDEDFGD